MSREERLLTIDEAYAALLRFLKLYYATLGNATIADVLGDGSLAAPRNTVDPGVWDTWLEALNEITGGAFNEMAEEYHARWQTGG
jgi:hypothetical protein